MTVGIWLWVITEYLQSWKALERNRKWWLTSPVCVQNTYFVQSSVRGQVSHHTTLVKTQLFSLSSCSWRCFWWCCCSLTWTKTRHIPVVNAFKNSSQRGKTKQNTTPHTPHTAAFSTDYLYQQPRVWGEWLPKAVCCCSLREIFTLPSELCGTDCCCRQDSVPAGCHLWFCLVIPPLDQRMVGKMTTSKIYPLFLYIALWGAYLPRETFLSNRVVVHLGESLVSAAAQERCPASGPCDDGLNMASANGFITWVFT